MEFLHRKIPADTFNAECSHRVTHCRKKL